MKLAAAASILPLILLSACGSGSDDTGGATRRATPRPAASSTPPPAPAWQSGAPLSDVTTREALAAAKEMERSEDLGKPSGLVIEGTAITVTYKAENALGETDLLTIGGQTSFSAARALFANPEVERVTVLLFADWIDQLGNTGEELTTRSTLTRATAAGINWDGLEDRVLVDNKHFYCISDEYQVHRGIYSRLKDVGCLLEPAR